MLGLYVSVPVACFRKGLAREYLETEPLPPPATCYGFLLSLVGETDRRQHVGSRIAPVLLNRPEMSVVLRTVWRVKKTPLGSPGNTRPDYQQLLTDVKLLVWVDSGGESGNGLEGRVRAALANPGSISRFGAYRSARVRTWSMRFRPGTGSRSGSQATPVRRSCSP